MSLVLALITVAATALTIFGLLKEQERRRAIDTAWLAAARNLGLEHGSQRLRRPRGMRRFLEGEWRGVSVRAEYDRVRVGRGKTQHLRESIEFRAAAAGIPPKLDVRRDTLLRSLGRLVGGRDDEVGDQAFDALVELPTVDARISAALDASARRLLAELVRAGGVVRQGAVVLPMESRPVPRHEWLEERLQWVARVAQALVVEPADVPPRLAHNALHDPVPSVRGACLRALLAEARAAERPLVQSTSAALLSDPDPELRLLAAGALGVRGHSALLALATGGELPAAIRVRALEALSRGGFAELESLLGQILRGSPPELAAAAFELVAERRLTSLGDRLLEAMRSPHSEVRAAAAKALGAVGLVGAEAALLPLLRDGSRAVQLSAIESLAARGGVTAVQPLRELAGGLASFELGRAARGAIERIQARLAGAGPGQISLVEEARGAVDLAPPGHVRGNLDLAGDE